MECELCGTPRPWLHKHHVKPRAQGGTDADGLTLLCANCHEDVHGGPCGGTGRGGLANTPEARAKKSASLKQAWANPEHRERWVSSRRGAWSDERRRNHREGLLAWRERDPEAWATRNQRISEAKRKQG